MLPAIITALAFASMLRAPERSGAWTAPSVRCEALAAGLRIAPVLRPVVAGMCQRAPTFRRQVVRLARQPGLEVTVATGAFESRGRARARTAMTRVDGQLRSARVEVPGGDPALLAELVAHEFEHILEQLDDVDLASWAGRSGVYRVGGSDQEGPFETERARQVGRLVAGEYLSAGAEMTAFKVR
ncbi:MAG: hypothetical protein ABIT71_08100 [Vicinamibacteraceae bacterium]